MKCKQCNERNELNGSTQDCFRHMRPICTKCRKYNIHQFVNGTALEKIPNIGSSLSVYLEDLEDEV